MSLLLFKTVSTSVITFKTNLLLYSCNLVFIRFSGSMTRSSFNHLHLFVQAVICQIRIFYLLRDETVYLNCLKNVIKFSYIIQNPVINGLLCFRCRVLVTAPVDVILRFMHAALWGCTEAWLCFELTCTQWQCKHDNRVFAMFNICLSASNKTQPRLLVILATDINGHKSRYW